MQWASGEPVTYTDAWDHFQPDLNWDDEGSGKCTKVHILNTGSVNPQRIRSEILKVARFKKII